MLGRDEVLSALERFLTHVANQSKRNLTLNSSNKTKRLHKSIKGDVKANPNSLEADIEIEDYWKFINYGIRGVESGNSLKNWRFKNHATPFKKGAGVIPPTGAFRTDKINRPVSFGQARASAINVWKHGIKPTQFFTKPFEAAFKNLPEEVIEAYGLDLEEFIEFTLNE